MSVTDEIKGRLDIISYIQQYVPIKKAGRYYKANCPFHNEKTPSFSVNPDTQSWRCFGSCAEGGDIFSFAMKYHGWDFKEAQQQLGRQAGVEVEQQSPEQRQQAERADQIRGLLQTAADTYHKYLLSDTSDDARAVLRYATEKRGFTLDTIKSAGIGYAPPGWHNMLDELTQLGYDESLVIEAGIAVRNTKGNVYDRFRNRLMVPIRDERGRVVGFGARILDPDDTPKYLNSPQTAVFDKSQLLFGLDVAKRAIRDTETAVIVEGYMDAIQAHQAGFVNVVAQMGTAMTETQLKLLTRYANKIILALDSDAAGQNATRRSLETARQTLEADFSGRLSVDIRILQIPDAKDPDDLIRETPDKWQQLIDEAVPVADFVIQSEVATLPKNASFEERKAVASRIAPLLMATEDTLQQNVNLGKLAAKLKVDDKELRLWALANTDNKFNQRPRTQLQERKSYRKQSPPPARQDGGGSMQSPPQPTTPGLDDAPPPPDYDNMEPPPDYDDVDVPPEFAQDLPSPPIKRPASAIVKRLYGATDRSLEQYCLRVLFTNSDAYYGVNRKLRELAGENANLYNGPLQNFDVADFIYSEHQALMQMFTRAVQQDEMDVLDYVRQNLDASLLQNLEQMLLDDDTGVNLRLNARFGGDLKDLMKQHNRRVKPSINLHQELLYSALLLRQERLQRQIIEMKFMIEEDQGEVHYEIMQSTILAQLALQLLQAALNERQISHFP